jgi:hypothetical protein
MVGLTFCIIMLPSARVTRGGTSHLHAAAAVPRFTRGKRRRRHARVAECSAPGSRAQSRAAAVHRGQAQSRAAAGVRRPPAQCPAQCAPPPKCYCAVVPLPAQLRATAGVRRPSPAADNAVARADGDPRGTECPRIYACARACQYECTQSNLQNAS